MVLGKLPVPGILTIWVRVGQGLTALAVGAGGSCLNIFSLFYYFSFVAPSLWETALCRLKYCLKGPLNPKQPTNQRTAGQEPVSCAWLFHATIQRFWLSETVSEMKCYVSTTIERQTYLLTLTSAQRIRI